MKIARKRENDIEICVHRYPDARGYYSGLSDRDLNAAVYRIGRQAARWERQQYTPARQYDRDSDMGQLDE